MIRRIVETVCWTMAAVLLGIYVFVLIDRQVYQKSEGRRFDRELQTHAGPAANVPPKLRTGQVIGRIEIPRIGLRAMVADGTTDEVLRRAVGRIEGTALPGQPGNIGLAGHRDTFFRGLGAIQKGDTIVLTTLEGTYTYEVESLRIADPDAVDLLRATAHPSLTLVTCYPFHYVGAAPDRFVVRARLVGDPAKRSPRGS